MSEKVLTKDEFITAMIEKGFEIFTDEEGELCFRGIGLPEREAAAELAARRRLPA